MIRIKTLEMEATFKKDSEGVVTMSEEKILNEVENREMGDQTILSMSKEISDFNQKELTIIKASLNKGEERTIKYTQKRLME